MDIQSVYYEAGIILFWLLFAYLFMDKFLFRGQLGEICFGKARRRMAKALRSVAGWFDPVKEEQKKGRKRTKGKMEKKGSRTMRKTWKKLAAMAVTASMVICGGAMGVSAATEEEKPEKVTVNVAYMPDYASLNGLISAIELGYFDDENIDVQLTEFSDGPTIIQAMESGSIDVGYIGQGAHKLCINGKADIFALAHVSNGDAVIGSKEKGTDTIEGLKGKTIAYSSGTSSEDILNKTLAKGGMTMDDITAMDMDATNIVTGFDYRADHSHDDEVCGWIADKIKLEKNSLLDQVEVADWTTSEFIRDHMDDVKGYYELQQKSFVESGDCEETPVDNYVLFDVMEEACAE